MKKNLYYTKVVHMEYVFDAFQKWVLQMFLSIPKALLQVFTRRDFGVRHINPFRVVLTVLFYAYMPIVYDPSLWHEHMIFVILLHPLYYAFLAVVLVLGIVDRARNWGEPGEFDFARYSYSNGEYLPYFRKQVDALERRFPIMGNQRVLDIYLEPLFFLAAGIVLFLFSQALGIAIMVSAVFYSFSFAHAYMMGDTYVLDIIDQQIANEEMAKNFAADDHDTRGFQFRGHLPNTEEGHRHFLDATIVDETFSRNKEVEVV